MKNGILARITLVTGLLFGLAANVNANSITAVPASPSINVGSQVSVDLNMVFTDTTVGGAFDLFYDPAVLGLVSFTYDPTFTTTVSDPMFSPAPDDCFTSGGAMGGCMVGDGELNAIAMASFMGITGSHTIGTVVFEALSAGASALAMLDNDAGLGGFLDFSTFNPMNVAFVGDSITVMPQAQAQAPAAVPLPASGWLMMLGLAGVMARRQRKSAS